MSITDHILDMSFQISWNTIRNYYSDKNEKKNALKAELADLKKTTIKNVYLKSQQSGVQ